MLEIDPYTAEVVQRIFAEFLAGKGFFAIAEGLTADGILSPSAYDRARNRHRCGLAWSKSAVRVIVNNPRYTGRQVWNKQRKREVLIDVHDVTLGHETKLTWNTPDQWVWSKDIVNPPIIDEETFKAAQELLAARGHGPARHKPHRARHLYVLRGILHCGICHRKMEGSWNNGAPYYRCRFPEEYALANKIMHPRNVYLRESVLLPRLDRWLGRYFAPHRRADIAALIEEIADYTQALATADPAHKAGLYGKLGLQLTYHPEQQKVRAEAHLDPAPYGEMVRVRGATHPVTPHPITAVGVLSTRTG